MFGHLKWFPPKLFSLLVQSFSLLPHPLAPSCVWKQLLPHLYHGATVGSPAEPGQPEPPQIVALSSRSLIWPGPVPGCMELSAFVFSPHRAPVPTKSVALKCSGQSRKRKHQGNAGAGIRRGRRLVMRSELCVLGKLIRWLSLIRDWPGTVWGDNRCPQDTMGGELRPRTHTEGGSLHLTEWIF